jgi:hypothetical protein
VIVSFGRQKNLVRRAIRPDGRFTRDVRRRSVGSNSLLEAQSAKPSLSLRFARLLAKILRRSS